MLNNTLNRQMHRYHINTYPSIYTIYLYNIHTYIYILHLQFSPAFRSHRIDIIFSRDFFFLFFYKISYYFRKFFKNNATSRVVFFFFIQSHTELNFGHRESKYALTK